MAPCGRRSHFIKFNHHWENAQLVLMFHRGWHFGALFLLASLQEKINKTTTSKNSLTTCSPSGALTVDVCAGDILHFKAHCLFQSLGEKIMREGSCFHYKCCHVQYERHTARSIWERVLWMEHGAIKLHCGCTGNCNCSGNNFCCCFFLTQ